MQFKFRRLNHVQIIIPAGADAEAQAREFYAGLLGLSEIPKPEPLRANGGLWFRVADVELHLGVEPVTAKTKRHPAFEVENLEAMRALFTERGVRVKDETRIPGVERFSFFDPFDNRIEVMELTGV
jgi:catechol 2,3-dioxygenase-like lactoylglutathione lyase family enzyme